MHKHTLLLLPLFAVPVLAQTTLLNETFSNGLPSGYVVQDGSARVTGGVLTLSSACVQLPGPGSDRKFSRTQGLVIEADVKINDGGTGDFNIWGLYDTLSSCPTGPRNGYYTGWFPAGSDSPNDGLDVVTNNTAQTLGRTPARMSANKFYHLKQEFLTDGTINTYIDGQRTMTATNNSYTTGFLTLRSWQGVDIDNLLITTSSGSTGSLTAPTLISPTDGASNIGTSPTLQWTTVAGATANVVMFGTTNPPTNRISASGTTINPAATLGTLGGSLTYYWNVRATNSTTEGPASPTWRFTTVTTCTAPSITTQPQNQTIASGQAATLSVSVAGTAPLTYQWYLGTTGDTNKPLSNANGPSVHVSPSSSSAYWMRVSNACGHADSTSVAVSVQSPSIPTFSEATVVNAASGQPGLVPGSLATIYGANLANLALSASTIPWPTGLGGTSVLINGIVAPIAYISKGQINFQVPWETSGSFAKVIVDNSGTISDSLTVPVLATQPAVYLLTSTQAAIARQDWTTVSPTNPAQPNEYITIYLNGLGAVTNQPATGSPAGTSLPYSTLQWTPIVYINGHLTPVLYAGLAPGFTGLYQLNVQAPSQFTGNPSAIQIISTNPWLDTFTTLNNVRWMAADHDGPGGITRLANVACASGCPVTNEGLGLVVTVPGAGSTLYSTYTDANNHQLTGAGGQVQTSSAGAFGRYEVAMQTAASKGTVNGFFIYLAGQELKTLVQSAGIIPDAHDVNEIDIEVLSADNITGGVPTLNCGVQVVQDYGFAHFTVHLLKGRSITYKQQLCFAPWKGIHTYAFEWTTTGVRWFVDNTEVNLAPAGIQASDAKGNPEPTPGSFLGSANAPQFPGRLIVNHWTNNDPSWSNGPPTQSTTMMTSRVQYTPVL